MFGLGLWEIIIILLIAVVFIRPRDLPKIVRKIGYYYGRWREFSERISHTMSEWERDFTTTPPPGEAESPEAGQWKSDAENIDGPGEEKTREKAGSEQVDTTDETVYRRERGELHSDTDEHTMEEE
jgi:Sec-independent protein translocase protein TatA